MSQSLFLLLTPLALLLPSAAGGLGDEARLAPERAGEVRKPDGPAARLALAAEAWREVPVQDQVRIEQRMIIRIAPAPPPPSLRPPKDLPRQVPRQGLREVGFGGCVEIDGIVGIQPTNANRLVLFLRDRQMLSAELERSCNAQDFYSGAYVERSRDGRFCAKRERLQSRTGAICQVAKLNRLVAERN